MECQENRPDPILCAVRSRAYDYELDFGKPRFKISAKKILFELPEQFLVGGAFQVAKMFALEKMKKSLPEARRIADDIARKSQNMYENHNKPGILRNQIIDDLFPFQAWAANAFNELFRDLPRYRQLYGENAPSPLATGLKFVIGAALMDNLYLHFFGYSPFGMFAKTEEDKVTVTPWGMLSQQAPFVGSVKYGASGMSGLAGLVLKAVMGTERQHAEAKKKLLGFPSSQLLNLLPPPPGPFGIRQYQKTWKALQKRGEWGISEKELIRNMLLGEPPPKIKQRRKE